jgi:hypothetical protein
VALGCESEKGYTPEPSAFLLGCQYLMFISLDFVLFFGEKHFFS